MVAGRSNDNSNNNNITTTAVYDTAAPAMGPVGPTVAQPPADRPFGGWGFSSGRAAAAAAARARSSRPDRAGQRDTGLLVFGRQITDSNCRLVEN